MCLYILSASIFAYGQTSSGKTYTMVGITEFAVADIFDYIKRVIKPLISCIIYIRRTLELLFLT
jgi:hypothetical protein